RPYHPKYHPHDWRGWWAFGSGFIGDFACHYMDVVHWALDLREPQTIEAEGPEVNPESTPAWLKVKYHYAARADQPPVNLTWYNGGKLPAVVESGEVPKWGKIIFVGQDGVLATDYRQHKLFPADKFKDYTPPTPTIPKSVGHHLEWVNACKSGGETT